MSNESENIHREEINLVVEEEDVTPEVNAEVTLPPLSHQEQIKLKQDGDLVYICLPSQKNSHNNSWERMIDDFKIRIEKMDKSWLPETKVYLESDDRLLDTRQIRDLNYIIEQYQLKLDLVITQRRQTAVAAASAGYSVRQNPSISLFAKTPENPQQNLAEPLYIKQNLRSGVQISHASTVIVFGDVNPGAKIIAGGDVYVWGTLKGIAQAGVGGNRECLIMALKMNPTQLRIADLVARAPDDAPENSRAEVAYISSEGIRIREADSFRKLSVFNPEKQCWVNNYNSEIRFEKSENLTIQH